MSKLTRLRLGLLGLVVVFALSGSFSMAMMGGTISGDSSDGKFEKQDEETQTDVEAPEVEKETIPEVKEEEKAPEPKEEEKAPEPKEEEKAPEPKEEKEKIEPSEVEEPVEQKEVAVSNLEKDTGQEEVVEIKEKKPRVMVRWLASMINFIKNIRGDYMSFAPTKFQKVCNLFLNPLYWMHEKSGGVSLCDAVETYKDKLLSLKNIEIYISSKEMGADLKTVLKKIKSGNFGKEEIATLKEQMEKEEDKEKKDRLEALVKFAQAKEDLKSIAQEAQSVAGAPVTVKTKKIQFAVASKLETGMFFQSDYDKLKELLSLAKDTEDKTKIRNAMKLGAYQIAQRTLLEEQEENKKEMEKIVSEYESNNSLSTVLEGAKKFTVYDKDALDSSSFDVACKQLKKERAATLKKMTPLYKKNKKIEGKRDPFLKAAFKSQLAG